MFEGGTIEERPSQRGSPPPAIVAKRKGCGTLRFCADYRCTLERPIVRKNRPMPDLESCPDPVGEALYISTHNVLSAFRRIPMAEEHVDRIASVTTNNKHCLERMLC